MINFNLFISITRPFTAGNTVSRHIYHCLQQYIIVSILVNQISPYLVKALDNSTLTDNLNLCILFLHIHALLYVFAVLYFLFHYKKRAREACDLRQTVVTENITNKRGLNFPRIGQCVHALSKCNRKVKDTCMKQHVN